MPHAPITYPKSRQHDVLVEQVGDDTVVYDPTRRTMHSLNSTAAAVWRNCDGALSVPEVAERVSGELGASADDSVVEYALDRLAGAHLLENASVARGVTRRAMLKRMTAAVAVPVVLSLVTPTPAMAASLTLPPDPGPDIIIPPDPGEDF